MGEIPHPESQCGLNVHQVRRNCHHTRLQLGTHFITVTRKVNATAPGSFQMPRVMQSLEPRSSRSSRAANIQQQKVTLRSCQWAAFFVVVVECERLSCWKHQLSCYPFLVLHEAGYYLITCKELIIYNEKPHKPSSNTNWKNEKRENEKKKWNRTRQQMVLA